jgi:hypothetical protein
MLLTKAVLVANEANEVEVKVDETKYVVTSGKQNAGQCHNIKLGTLFRGKFHLGTNKFNCTEKHYQQTKFKDSLLVMGQESDVFPVYV